MIISASELSLSEFNSSDIVVTQDKIDAVESLIRSYTHNNFQQRDIRFSCRSSDRILFGSHPCIKSDDTVEISNSRYNNGIYTVHSVSDGQTILCDIRGCKAPINEDEYNLVTKVVYPSDVVRGAINLIVWDLKNRDKTGISSETIGRHSVSYFNMDGDNSVMGYPKSLLGFLKPYIKARF